MHCTEWHSFLAAYRVFAPDGLTPEEEDRYIAEGAIIGSLLGTPREMVPASDRRDGRLLRAGAARAAHERGGTAPRSTSWSGPRPTRDILPYYVPLLRVRQRRARARARRDPATRRASSARPPSTPPRSPPPARWLTAAQLPLLNRLARQVVGRKTIDLIDSRLRPAAPDPAVELGLRQAA